MIRTTTSNGGDDEAAIRPTYKQLGVILPEEIEERAWGSLLTPFPWYLQFSVGLDAYADYDYREDPLGIRIKTDRYGEQQLTPLPGELEVDEDEAKRFAFANSKNNEEMEKVQLLKVEHVGCPDVGKPKLRDMLVTTNDVQDEPLVASVQYPLCGLATSIMLSFSSDNDSPMLGLT